MVIYNSILACSFLALVSACSESNQSPSSTGILPGEDSDSATDTTTGTTGETSSEISIGTVTTSATGTGTGTGLGSDSEVVTEVPLTIPDRIFTINGIGDQAATIIWNVATGDAVIYRVCVGLSDTAMTTATEVVTACDSTPLSTPWGSTLTAALVGMTSDQEQQLLGLAERTYHSEQSGRRGLGHRELPDTHRRRLRALCYQRVDSRPLIGELTFSASLITLGAE